MDYQGPSAADFANVAALNRGYLSYLRRNAGIGGGKREIGPAFRPLIANLTEVDVRRLAEAPFLLFSLREMDGKFWNRLFAAAPDADLFAQPLNADAFRIVAAALAFLWQLANQNPFAARVLAGATPTWCEALAESTLYRLLRRAGTERGMLEPRLADNAAFWKRLLSTGLHSESGIRRAAQVSTLQIMLTEAGHTKYRRLASAACRLPAESLQVAEKIDSRRR